MSNKNGSYKELLQEKQFLKMMCANVISRFGDSLDIIAFSWMVYAITGSPVWIAVIFGCNSLPSIILQPFAGVYVERISKKRMMVICDLARGILVSFTAFLYIQGQLSPWTLVIITMINSSFESLRIPAGIAITPHILNPSKYNYGMALSSTMSRVAEVLGIISAGAVVGLLGVHYAMAIDATTFFMSAIIISMIKYQENLKLDAETNMKQFLIEMKEGFGYLKEKRIVYYVCLFGSLIGFILIPLNNFSVIYIQDILQLGPEGMSVYALSIVVGMGIGAFITPKVKEKWTGRHMLSIAGIIIGISFFIMIAISNINSASVLYIIMAINLILLGIAAGIIQVIINVTFMSNVESDYLSRVGSLFNALAMSVTPVGTIVFGGLASFVSVSEIYIITGILTIILFMSVYRIKAFKTL